MQEIVTTIESEIFYIIGQMKNGFWRWTTSQIAGVQSCQILIAHLKNHPWLAASPSR